MGFKKIFEWLLIAWFFLMCMLIAHWAWAEIPEEFRCDPDVVSTTTGARLGYEWPAEKQCGFHEPMSNFAASFDANVCAANASCTVDDLTIVNQAASSTDECLQIDSSGVVTTTGGGCNAGSYFTILDYGAVCDGSTDDSAAIQAAENAADDVCGTVLIPPDPDGCAVDASVRVSECVTVAGLGWGSLIKATSGIGAGEPIFQSDAEPTIDADRDFNITFRDFAIDGSGASDTTTAPCILLRAVIDGVVDNVRCESPEGDCVTISRSGTTVFPLRNTVRGLHCVSPDRQGIAVTSGHQLVLVDNQIQGGAMHGIDLELETESTLVIEDVTIAGNVIEDMDASTTMCGIAITGDTSGQQINDVTVVGNTIDDPGRGICFRHTTNLTIDGNTIRSSSEDGIHSVTTSDAPDTTIISNNLVADSAQYGFNWTRSTPVTFVGNRIENSTNHGIRLANSTGSTIASNTVDTVGGTDDCISLSDATNTLITGNTLYNCPDDGVYVSATASGDGTLIVGNVIEADGNCVETTNAGGATPDYTTVLGNRFVSCATTTSLTGTNTVSMNASGSDLLVDTGALRSSSTIRADTGISIGTTLGSGEQLTVYRAAGGTTIVDIDNGAGSSRLQFSSSGTEIARIEATSGSPGSLYVTAGEVDMDLVLRAGGNSSREITIDGATGNVTTDQDISVNGGDISDGNGSNWSLADNGLGTLNQLTVTAQATASGYECLQINDSGQVDKSGVACGGSASGWTATGTGSETIVDGGTLNFLHSHGTITVFDVAGSKYISWAISDDAIDTDALDDGSSTPSSGLCYKYDTAKAGKWESCDLCIDADGDGNCEVSYAGNILSLDLQDDGSSDLNYVYTVSGGGFVARAQGSVYMIETEGSGTGAAALRLHDHDYTSHADAYGHWGVDCTGVAGSENCEFTLGNNIGGAYTAFLVHDSTALELNDAAIYLGDGTYAFDHTPGVGIEGVAEFDDDVYMDSLDNDEDRCVYVDSNGLLTADSTACTVTTDLWHPFGHPTSTSLGTGADENCECWLFHLPTAITPDKLAVSVATTDANDSVFIAVYSEDGNTEHAECEVDLTSYGVNPCTTTVGPTQMTPGDYWVCLGFDDGGDGFGYAVRSSMISAELSVHDLTTTCTAGNPPSTISFTKVTASDYKPYIGIVDD